MPSLRGASSCVREFVGPLNTLGSQNRDFEIVPYEAEIRYYLPHCLRNAESGAASTATRRATSVHTTQRCARERPGQSTQETGHRSRCARSPPSHSRSSHARMHALPCPCLRAPTALRKKRSCNSEGLNLWPRCYDAGFELCSIASCNVSPSRSRAHRHEGDRRQGASARSARATNLGDAHALTLRCRKPAAQAHAHLVTMRPSRSEFGVRKWEEVADREVARCGALTRCVSDGCTLRQSSGHAGLRWRERVLPAVTA